MTKKDDATATALSEISDSGLISHLGAGFYPVNAQFEFAIGTLPYPPSNGPWLERLCFLLLRSQGFVPRYFGNSGQKDRGVDLLVTSGDQLFVYQCKNVQSFSPGDMAKALKRFEDEWLKSSGLPKPNKFILCCPSLLRGREPNEDWTKLERDFQSRTGVDVECWHRNFLDETLKSLPDIVAEVFSDQIATLFCECDDWNYDQFSPVVADSPDRYIKRYQERKATDRIYLDPDLAAEFTEKLERNGSVLIMGLPGSGKTTTSFALAEELPNRRTYYVTLRETISDNDLVNGIGNRLSRQTIFLVDDCQGRFAQLDSVMNRVNRLLQGKRNQAFFVFLTRTTPTPGDLVRGDDMTEFEEELKQADSVLRFTVDQQTFRRIIEQTKPEFGSLSDERLASIYEFTGHDLFLLDQMLETIDDERGIDDLNLEYLFGKTIVRYFGKGTVDRPGFMNLAALAQFEIAPRVAGFPIDLETEDARAAAELVVQAGRPPRYFFLHSSAAELVFRALVKNDGIEDHAGTAAGYLIQFFKSRSPDDKALADDLSKAIRNRLKLADDEAEENRLKSAFLADEGIYALIEGSFETLPLNLVASCLIALKNSSSSVLERYLALVGGKIEDGAVLKSAATHPFWESNMFLWLMKRAYQPLFIILSKQFSDSGDRSLLRTTDLPDYLRLLSTIAGSEKHVWFESLNLIPDDEIEAMIQRTMNAGRSIGTLHFALREVKHNAKPLLILLEEKIGAARFLRLIAANGSIFELFMLIRYSSLPMAEKLIASLDDPLLDQLIEQTITFGRSIGTLNLALRELKQNDEALLTRLEGKIGAARLLRLIVANGSIFELFMLIKNCSLPMSENLIAALDNPVLDQLVDQTISSGRSIGSLHWTLEYLKLANGMLLRKLEEKIGESRWWRLVCSFGSISILVDLLPAMDNSFRQRFVQAARGLSAEAWQKLLLQRDFYDLCYFVKNVPFFFSAKFRPEFLKPIFVTLIQAGDWKARNTGWSLLSAAEDSVGKNYLVKLLYEQIGDIQPGALSFPAIAEAAHCVNLLWRLLPAKRRELLDALHRFVAEGKPIYCDPAYMRSVRFLFSTLATPQAEDADARMMHAIGNAPAVAPLCAKATTLDMFLYLWNLYALWFEWKSPQENSFVGFLRIEIVEATIASLPKRFRAAKDEKETGNLITLTGLLSFLGVTVDRPSAAEDFASRLLSFDKLIDRLDEDRPFIPSVFYLLGLEWLYQADRGVPAVVWWDELGKANDYPETTAALEYVKVEATKRSRVF
ncbi:MAG: hypothetical protein AABO57_14845 [Acidobacteriota bacterium]